MANIIYFGNSRLAQGLEQIEQTPLKKLLEAGHKITAIVHRGGKDDLEVDNFASSHKIPVHRSTKLNVDELRGIDADIGILAAYGALLPQAALDLFPHGIINIHPSLLPQYRGPTPIEQAILDGAPKTGVSLMKVTAEMDAGPLYTYQTVHLNGSETKQELAQELLDLGATLLFHILPEVLNGKLKPKAQPHPNRATYTQKINKSDGRIDWNKPAEVIEREIRAYAGWPGSYTTLANYEVIVTNAHSVPVNNAGNKPGDLDILKDVGNLVVECAKGYLCIERLKPKDKKEMSSGDFIRGYLNRLG